jgi:hypothetical protein
MLSRILTLIGMGFAILLASGAQSSAQTIVGPGVVPAPLTVGNTHILTGTEIIATHSFIHNGGVWIQGGAAAITNWGTDLFVDGGLFKGASVTTLASTQQAYGGDAFAFGNGYNYATFYGGTYVGGSVLVDPATFGSADLKGGAAISVGGDDSLFDFKIYGGTYEGGIVSLAAAPEIAVSRAPALKFLHGYAGPLDVFGGEFIGGIEVADVYFDIKIHGSEFNVQPPPVNGRFDGPANVIVSGKYHDGTPFSHQLSLKRFGETYVYEMGDYLAISSTNIPEPTALSLLAIGGMIAWASRRRRR